MAEIFLARPGPGASASATASATASLSGTGASTADKRGAVVVKRLFSHHSAEKEFVRMFFNEARLAARLKHKNIVDIFDQGEIDGTYYLAMEYIAGEDLRSIAQQADVVGKRPPLAVVCRIIIDMLAGLHYAHTLVDDEGRPLGLVHRDISPQNVLVTYDGVVKVIDFGIAKATQAHNNEQTQAGLIKGKYAYMSPEQTRSGALDARSDVFSAGILLWELVAWRRLFKRASDLATLVAVTEEPAPSMTLYTPEVPRELDEVVLKALAMDPADRWASAREFHDALLACIEQLGWDGSSEELGRYMRELFQQKLQAERKQEARAALDAERAASAMSMRLASSKSAGGTPTAPPAPPGPRMTMPLQVINPAMAAAARKTMQQGRPGAPPPPKPADGPPHPSGRSLQRPATPAEQRPAPALPPASAPSGSSQIPPAPLPPPPSFPPASLPSTMSKNPLSISGSTLSQGRSSSMTPPPSASSATGGFGPRSDPMDALTGERPRSTQTLMPQSPSQFRVILAVVLGVVVGVLAVLMLQYLGARPHR
ncbi:MAG TPA: serine/threonine-protein kinase [Pseudomonadota bacterium]|nr:serine/threonine-protein kinase [Pseudomonadota bacterium]